MLLYKSLKPDLSRIFRMAALVCLLVFSRSTLALADTAGGLRFPGGDRSGGLLGMLPFVVVVGLFYALMIRPQQKKQREVKDMLDALSVGDTVVTSGGIIGKISSIDKDADTVTVMVDDKVSLLMYRKFIIELLDKKGSSAEKSGSGQARGVKKEGSKESAGDAGVAGGDDSRDNKDC